MTVLLTLKHVTFNDTYQRPFCVKFCFAPVRLELGSLAFEATLKLAVNVVSLGGAENAGPENGGPENVGPNFTRWNLQDWKMQDQ